MGGADLKGDSTYSKDTVNAVAKQMSKTINQNTSSFIINTGDNF